jgi:hypothetical protein
MESGEPGGGFLKAGLNLKASFHFSSVITPVKAPDGQNETMLAGASNHPPMLPRCKTVIRRLLPEKAVVPLR